MNQELEHVLSRQCFDPVRAVQVDTTWFISNVREDPKKLCYQTGILVVDGNVVVSMTAYNHKISTALDSLQLCYIPKSKPFTIEEIYGNYGFLLKSPIDETLPDRFKSLIHYDPEDSSNGVLNPLVHSVAAILNFIVCYGHGRSIPVAECSNEVEVIGKNASLYYVPRKLLRSL